MERMFEAAYNYKLRGTLPALEEQYEEISIRLSHVYSFIMNNGHPNALIHQYGYSLLDGVPNSRRTSLRPYLQLGTHGVLVDQDKNKEVLAFNLTLYSGEPPETAGKPNMRLVQWIHRRSKHMKVPEGMPLDYVPKIGILELNRSFEWFKAEPLWGSQQQTVRHIQNVVKPVYLNLVDVVLSLRSWINSEYLFMELSHRPAMKHLQEVVIYYHAMIYLIIHHLTKLIWCLNTIQGLIMFHPMKLTLTLMTFFQVLTENVNSVPGILFWIRVPLIYYTRIKK
jgi:hypothetical protein